MPAPVDGDDAESGIAFASQNWRRAVTDRRRPGMVARRHFEAMVFTYLAEELRAVADGLSRSTIDTVLAKSDLELGIEALMRRM